MTYQTYHAATRTLTVGRMFRGLLYSLIVVILTPLPFSASATESPAGKVTALDGEAWVGEGFWGKKELKVGSIIYAGDTLQTDDDSRINMRFLDKTFFTLGPDAKMKVDTYDESDNAAVSFGASILQGAFRFVSGLLSKKEFPGDERADYYRHHRCSRHARSR